MKHRITIAFALCLAAAGTAAADDSARARLGGNAFEAGGSVTLDEAVPGNAFVSGGDVEVIGPVGRNLFAAGGEVTLGGQVDGNARMAGGTIRVAPEGRVVGNATLAGGSITVDGPVDGDLRAFGERLTVNGKVNGDVQFAGDELRFGPGAHIGGSVVYTGASRLTIDPAAQVAGAIKRVTDERDWRRLTRGATIVGGITVSFGMVLLGALIVLALPRFSREAAASIRRMPWQSLGLGCALLVGVPVLLALLVVTLIGIPLAVMLAFAYGALLVLGWLVAALFIGDTVLERIDAKKLESSWWRVLFLVLAIVAVAFIRRVPVAGPLVWSLLFLAGVGAFSLRTWQGFRGEPAAVTR
jgi:cytoskeletal protein CcmA (bactofilin family)